MNPTTSIHKKPRPGTIRSIQRERPLPTFAKSADVTRWSNQESVKDARDSRDLASQHSESSRTDEETASAVIKDECLQMESAPEAQDQRKISRLQRLLDDLDTNIDAVRELCWTGIPPELRATLWLMLMGIIPTNRSRRQMALEKRVQEYQSFARQHFSDTGLFTPEQMKSVTQIDLDLPRTSPGLMLFRLPAVQASLRRVLCIYSFRHPATGYVQGMNDLVTPFFYVFIGDIIGSDKDPLQIQASDLSSDQWTAVEAFSFWCLSRLMEGTQDHYTRDQPAIQWKLQALKSLMSQIDSELDNHLAAQEILYSFFAYRWMNCFLMRELSLPLIVRLWDTYFSESNDQGFSVFHVYACAAFLSRFSGTLKTMDMENILSYLQSDLTSKWTETDLTSLLSHAFVLRSTYKLQI